MSDLSIVFSCLRPSLSFDVLVGLKDLGTDFDQSEASKLLSHLHQEPRASMPFS